MHSRVHQSSLCLQPPATVSAVCYCNLGCFCRVNPGSHWIKVARSSLSHTCPKICMYVFCNPAEDVSKTSWKFHTVPSALLPGEHLQTMFFCYPRCRKVLMISVDPAGQLSGHLATPRGKCSTEKVILLKGKSPGRQVGVGFFFITGLANLRGGHTKKSQTLQCCWYF